LLFLKAEWITIKVLSNYKFVVEFINFEKKLTRCFYFELSIDRNFESSVKYNLIKINRLSVVEKMKQTREDFNKFDFYFAVERNDKTYHYHGKLDTTNPRFISDWKKYTPNEEEDKKEEYFCRKN
jgi:hypothetical protein